MSKQHTVPAFYLRGFLDPDSLKDKDPYLWVADFEKKRVFRRSPKNVTTVSGFYEWEKIDNVPSLESAHNVIETRAARVFKKLRGGTFVLSNVERYHLCLYIGFQISRTERFHERVGSTIVANAKTKLGDWIKDRDQLTENLADFAETRPGSTLTIDEVRKFINEEQYTIKPGKDRLHGLVIDLALKFVPVVGATKWTIYLAPDNVGFIATDQGVALLTPDAEPIEIDFESFRNPKLQIIIPISRDYALLMHQTDAPEDIVALDDSDMDNLQNSVLPTVERYVFAATEGDANRALENKM